LELEFFLRPTISRSVRLGIGPPFGTLDQILSFSSSDNYFILLSKAPSLTRKRVCSLQCNHSLVRLLTPNNHTLPSHLRLSPLTTRRDCGGGILMRLHTWSSNYQVKAKVKVTLRPTISRPVRLGVRHPSGTPRLIFLSP
jgi:hypothetical protein